MGNLRSPSRHWRHLYYVGCVGIYVALLTHESRYPWIFQYSLLYCTFLIMMSTIFFVPTTLAAARLGERGIGRGRIWTASELSNIAEIDSPTDIPTIGRLKARLGLEIIGADRDEDSRL